MCQRAETDGVFVYAGYDCGDAEPEGGEVECFDGVVEGVQDISWIEGGADEHYCAESEEEGEVEDEGYCADGVEAW